jgi:hypothetical protein
MVIRILDIVQSADTGDQGAIVFARLHQERVPTHSFGTRGDVFFQRLPAACILL